MKRKRNTTPVDWREVRAIMFRSISGARLPTPEEHELLLRAIGEDRPRYCDTHAAATADAVNDIRRFWE